MGRKYMLHPSFDSFQVSSPDVKKASKFSAALSLDPKITIEVKGIPIITFKHFSDIHSLRWMGDLIEFNAKFDRFFDVSFNIFIAPKFLIVRWNSDTVEDEDVIEALDLDRNSISEVFQDSKIIYRGNFVILGNSLVDSTELNLDSVRKNWPNWIANSKSWLDKIPKTNQYVDNDLWEFVWVLDRLAKIQKHQSSQGITEEVLLRRLCCKEEITFLNFSQIVSVVENILWYRPQLAMEYLENGFNRYYNSETGCIVNLDSKSIKSVEVTHPPIWTFVVLELAKFTGQTNIISRLYSKLKRNLQWWEENRFNSNYGLFGGKLSVDHFNQETGMPHSPRFSTQYDGEKMKKYSGESKRNLLLIDLNSQMCDYYQNMGVMGMMVGDQSSTEYFQKAQNLQDRAQEFLWDPERKFYYDFDVDVEQIQPIDTIAGFWPLFGGLAGKSNVPFLVESLRDPNKFWAELPIPTLSMSNPGYSKEIWNGPVVLSQNLWIITGLKRYNLNKIAAQITRKVFRYLNSSFDLYHGVFPYYPAMSFNINSIQFNGQSIDNAPFYDSMAYYSCPIHALFYQGLLGVEVLDNSINFVPDWDVLEKEINFSFYYRQKKREEYLSKMDKKIVEIHD